MRIMAVTALLKQAQSQGADRGLKSIPTRLLESGEIVQSWQIDRNRKLSVCQMKIDGALDNGLATRLFRDAPSGHVEGEIIFRGCQEIVLVG